MATEVCDFVSYSCEAVGAIGSAGIAICAFFATIWQVVTTRAHNRLSVRPYLDSWEQFSPDGWGYQLKLMNNGIGPAVINDYSIFVDGKLIPGKGLKVMETALDLLLAGWKHEFSQSYLTDSYVMPAGEERTIVDLRFIDSAPTPEEFLALKKRIRLYIAYTDMYRETMPPLDTDKLAEGF